jgi:hypothetical protein
MTVTLKRRLERTSTLEQESSLSAKAGSITVPPFIVLFLRVISFFAAESDFAVPRFSAH